MTANSAIGNKDGQPTAKKSRNNSTTSAQIVSLLPHGAAIGISLLLYVHYSVLTVGLYVQELM